MKKYVRNTRADAPDSISAAEFRSNHVRSDQVDQTTSNQKR